MARAVVLEDHDVEQGHDGVLGQVDHVEDHDDLKKKLITHIRRKNRILNILNAILLSKINVTKNRSYWTG